MILMIAGVPSIGCFNPDLAGTRCSALDECPDGLVCNADRVCLPGQGSGGALDSAPPDSAPPDGAPPDAMPVECATTCSAPEGVTLEIDGGLITGLRASSALNPDTNENCVAILFCQQDGKVICDTDAYQGPCSCSQLIDECIADATDRCGAWSSREMVLEPAIPCPP